MTKQMVSCDRGDCARSCSCAACGKSEEQKQAEKAAEDLEEGRRGDGRGRGASRARRRRRRARPTAAKAMAGHGGGDGRKAATASRSSRSRSRRCRRTCRRSPAGSWTSRRRAHDLAGAVLAGRSRVHEGRREHRREDRRHRLRADADRAVVDVPGAGYSRETSERLREGDDRRRQSRLREVGQEREDAASSTSSSASGSSSTIEGNDLADTKVLHDVRVERRLRRDRCAEIAVGSAGRAG